MFLSSGVIMTYLRDFGKVYVFIDCDIMDWESPVRVGSIKSVSCFGNELL